MTSTLIDPEIGESGPPPAPIDVQEREKRAKAQGSVRWELLNNMVRRDLKLKYQNSALGFVWSLINPLFYLVVYGVIFGVLLKNGIPEFPIYLMSGLLLWNVFSGGVMGGAGSITGSAGLVRKVRFPVAVLPLAQVGFALVHYVLQMGVFLLVVVTFDLYSGKNSFGLQTLMLVPGVLIAVTFTIGMSFLVAALNVRYRDTAHLLELLLFAWFWASSIIYSSGLITQSQRAYPTGTIYVARHWYVGRLFFADPMATAVAFLHKAFITGGQTTTKATPPNQGQAILPATSYVWYAEQFALTMAVSLLLFWFARRLFNNWSRTFAEEL